MNKNISKILNLFENFKESKSIEKFEQLLIDKKFENNYRKDYNVQYPNAYTLDINCIGYCEGGKFTTYAVIQEDYYTWVNFFIVIFDDNKNFIIGDFEKTVISSNKKHLEIFLKYYQPKYWDYGDI